MDRSDRLPWNYGSFRQEPHSFYECCLRVAHLTEIEVGAQIASHAAGTLFYTALVLRRERAAEWNALIAGMGITPFAFRPGASHPAAGRRDRAAA